jgi:DNA-binding beta-propeller fold protein YncE
VPTTELGTVSAGPVFVIGNLLVMGVPKEHAGIVTMDVGDPGEPVLLDFDKPETESYIGWFYGRHAYLLMPFRTYDVTTDPSDIRLLGSIETPRSEYMSFGDGHLFLGSLRPEPGVFKYLLGDGTSMELLGQVRGRMRLGALLADDQFPLPIGNLLVMSDDESRIGSVLAVHDQRRDSRPPEVAYTNPVEGATSQPLTTRIGISFTDQIDLRSVDASTLVVRPVGGEPLTGSFAHMQTIVSFCPSAPLLPDTTYEVVLVAGGITDLVGNALSTEHRSFFATGDGLAAPSCALSPLSPVVVGGDLEIAAEDAGPDALYGFDLGDGTVASPSTAPSVAHAYDAPGRYPVTLTVVTDDGTRRCSATQIVHRPLTEAPPTRSSSVVVDQATTTVWVASPDADRVTAIDGESLEPRFEASVAAHPQTLAVAGDGTIWVACEDGDAIDILDPDDGAKVASIVLRYGAAPYGIAISPDGSVAWASLAGTGELVKIDVATREIVATVVLADEPMGAVEVRGIAVTGDGARVYVTRFTSPRSSRSTLRAPRFTR